MEPFLSFKNIVYIVMLSLVTCFNCLECNLSKEQMVIKLFAILLLKVCYCLILYHYTINIDYIHGTVLAVPGF